MVEDEGAGVSRVLTLGEALIDFVPVQTGLKLMDVTGFNKAPGGAPANVSVGLCRLGVQSGFIGKLGDDAFGYYLYKVLSENGVGLEGVSYTGAAKTSLAFITLTESGERDFLFYRDPGADMLLEEKDINPALIRKAEVLHFGALSLIGESSCSATKKAIELARLYGLKISFDPNLRLALWASPGSAGEAIDGVLDNVDLQGRAILYQRPGKC
jgi:sugar/nucleoside kinase (ribokinase family)